MRRPRVLVIDDSAFARTVLARLMRTSGQIDVVGTACDGREGLERIAALDPDVVTLDLTMPGIDGLGVLRALAGKPRPSVIVVSISTLDTDIAAEALSLGAVDLIVKPTALATDRLDQIGDELVAKVLIAAAGCAATLELAALVPTAKTSPVELVMIGTSTGGPQALTRIMGALPATLGVPVAIVLHIPAGYTESLALRLDHLSALRVVEAHDGIVLSPGTAVLARGGWHMHVVREGALLRARLSGLPIQAFTPSVDELFSSGAAAVGAGALGVVLTGMGDDGLIGARAIAAAGGSLVTEAAASCVVYGMSRCVNEAGLGATSLPIDSIAEEITRRV